MSHYRLKTTYNTEGSYGSIEVKKVFAHHNLGCDTVTFYDHDGEFIMTIPDTIDNNLLDAINRLYFPFKATDNGANDILDTGIEHMTQEELKLIKH